MTTDIKELVKRLREPRYASSDWMAPINTERFEAADAIEAMAGEVERLTVEAKAADMFHAINGHGIKQAEDLTDHIIRQMLWGMRIDDRNKGIVREYLIDHFKAVISRAEAAEAECARLKKALLDIKHFGPGFAQDRARKALGDAS